MKTISERTFPYSIDWPFYPNPTLTESIDSNHTKIRAPKMRGESMFSNVKEKRNYEFKAKSFIMIDIDMIYAELSYKDPIAVIVMGKDKFVIIHSSVFNKNEFLIKNPIDIPLTETTIYKSNSGRCMYKVKEDRDVQKIVESVRAIKKADYWSQREETKVQVGFPKC
jgi:hypothetical protein